MSTAKIVRVRKAGTSDPFAILPGNTADFNAEQGSGDDTIFGASYTSTQTTLTSWTVSANALYRGFAGYNTVIKKSGTPVPFTDEAMSEEELYSQTYIVDDQTTVPWDWKDDVTVYDNDVEVSSDDIASIDTNFGRVTFVDDYTVTGPITVDASTVPMTAFGNASSFDLTQNSDTTETTSFEIAQDNGGYSTFRPTLRTVSLSLTAFYRADNDFTDLLQSREDFVVEINPDGNEESVARGIFRVSSEGNSGDVGGDEETSVELVLAVPEGRVPFSWKHSSNTTMPEGLRIVLDAFENQDNLEVEYLPEGLGNPGKSGEVVLTDASMNSEVDGIVEAAFEGQGTGDFTEINNP